MSHMAQALQKQIDELRKAQRTGRRPRVVDEDPPGGGEVEDITEAVSAEQPPRESVTATEQQQEAPMTEKTRKRTQKAAAKAQEATKATAEIPGAVDGLRLAPDGVRAEERNRYINIHFVNGFSVRLLPVGVPTADVPKVRDLMAAWLKKYTSR